MIEFIGICASFVGNLLNQILNIPIGNIPFGVLIMIIIIIGLALSFLKGGKGD